MPKDRTSIQFSKDQKQLVEAYRNHVTKKLGLSKMSLADAAVHSIINNASPEMRRIFEGKLTNKHDDKEQQQ